MRDPDLSKKEETILRLLTERGPLFGLQLVNASSALRRGTVYVTLSQMVDKSYVEIVPDAEGPRKPYRATELGTRVLAALDSAPPSISESTSTIVRS